jgi:hydrogenase nickel incorporation protein HypB
MKKIQVVENVLKANDAVAAANRRSLAAQKLLTVNMMSSPGSGKTTLLEETMSTLGDPQRVAVLVGDLQTSRDAERLGRYALQAVQINTGSGCHLSATQVAQGLESLDLNGLDYLFIENVGNMVCPAGFDLGEHVRAVLLSVPEGDDKVAKYPTLFKRADVMLLTKVDLIGVLEFDRQRIHDDLAKVNSHVPVIEISCKTGQGLDLWLDWLREQRIRHTDAKQ